MRKNRHSVAVDTGTGRSLGQPGLEPGGQRGRNPELDLTDQFSVTDVGSQPSVRISHVLQICSQEKCRLTMLRFRTVLEVRLWRPGNMRETTCSFMSPHKKLPSKTQKTMISK